MYAFARPGSTEIRHDEAFFHSSQKGMSLRAYYAGQALVGMVAAGASVSKTDKEIAKAAFSLADAMMAAGGRDG